MAQTTGDQGNSQAPMIVVHTLKLRPGIKDEDFRRVITNDVFVAAAEVPGSVDRGGRSWIESQHLLLRNGVEARSYPLEVGALGHRQGLEVAAQAVEAELDGTQAHPGAAAIDARAAGLDALLASDREVDAAAEIDAVGAVIDLDQDREGVRGAGLLAHRTRHRLGGLAGEFA